MAGDVASINVLYWNANGVQRDLHDLYNYLETRRVDVALLCETFLKSDSKINSNPDYVFHRLDRDGFKGDIAILVKRGIRHSLLPHFGTGLVEALGIEVHTASTKISLISAYLPGGATRGQIESHYLNDLRILHRRRGSYFICGDFNSKHRLWNCVRANRAGSILFQELNQSDFLIQHPPTPTYVPLSSHKTPSTLDLVITNGFHEITQPVTDQAFMSDHLPVTFAIQTSTVLTDPPGSVPCYKRANWRLYMSHITNSIDLLNISLDRITTTDQVDGMVDHLTNLIVDARIAAVPNVLPYRYKLKLTSEISGLITFRNLCRRRWTRNKNRALKKFVNKLSKDIQGRITALRYSNFGQLLSTFHENRNKLWKMSKFLRNGRKTIPPIKAGGNLKLSSQEKADAIASSLAETFRNSNRYSPAETEVAESIQAIDNAELEPITADILATPTEIKKIIKILKTSKSPGVDEVNNRLLKNLPRKGIVYLTYLINACLKLGYFPNSWKKASVVPILKPGKDPSNPSSYRPISLLSSLGKILERVILKRLKKHIVENHLFLDEQFGFREKHSTSHQLLRVVKNIKNGLQNRRSTGMVLLDVEKAFDTVWHDGLVHKMFITRFPMRLIKIVRSFLSDRTFHVSVGEAKSDERNIPSGVPQGAVLSPSLYCFYTFDFPILRGVKLALFADDTAIYSTSDDPLVIQRDLQSALTGIAEYFYKWKIKVNASKTQSVFFTKRRTRGLPTANLVLDGGSIEWCNEAKYLGVTLDKGLTFKSHIQRTTEKTQKLIKILYPLINRRSRLDMRNKLLLYKMVFVPMILYASPIWDACALSHLRLLQIQQNKCLKMILNLHWTHDTSDVHTRAQMPTILENIEARHERFMNRLIFTENPIIESL
jgi:hypothetical protein